ncbi:E3 ubiquitin-protein ligase MARCHF7-like [Perca fluviatilis]|uniref:E3 ubiquitin-protein ligase MARCHF7-like n=1 Tax=Perca fluviatilis TaxID=8168 RepID=UPI001966139B|nr:E3 ubiquitin-protein ligase MARCHF7-like [Perca fluviatilis]
MQAFSTLLQRMSARKASKQPSPCSAGKSALSEPESQLNKDSESCLQAISSGTRSMSAELAMTSKIPHREKAPLASRLLPAKDHNDHRSERVKHKGLKGSTQASKQTQSRDVLKSNSKMKHLFNKTNVEDVIHPKAETTFAFPASTDTVPHVPTRDTGSLYSESEEEEEADNDPSSSLYSESEEEEEADNDPSSSLYSESEEEEKADNDPSSSLYSESEEEEEADNDPSGSCQGTFREATYPWQVSRSSSAFRCFSHSSHLSTSTVSPVGRHGYGPGPFLERTRRPHAASLLSTTDKLNRGFVGCVSSTQQTHQHLHKFQSSWPSTASSHRTVGFCSAGFAEKQSYRTTDYKSRSSNESWRLSASGQVDNLNVDDMTTCSDIKERVPSQECQEAREGATAAQNAQSLKDRSKETVCRPKQRLLDESSDEEEGEQCRICHSGESSPTNPLISPCLCSGSMQFVHLDCLKKWIRTKIESGSGPYTVKRCELCMGRLTLDPDTLHLDVYYREQQQQMLGNPDLYDLNDVFGMLRRPRLVHVPIWSLLSNLRRRLLRGRRNPSPQETSDT